MVQFMAGWDNSEPGSFLTSTLASAGEKVTTFYFVKKDHVSNSCTLMVTHHINYYTKGIVMEVRHETSTAQ